ncbi:MAG TPA: hypothetical protein VII06_31625 [Chloroflexota bacterium]|jgi:hypothetical protein
MSTFLVGLVVVALGVAVAMGGFLLVEHVWAHSARQRHNDVAGFIYAVLGIAYGVLVAYVVIVVWQNFSDAQRTCEQEANAVGDLYSLAASFPDPASTQLEQLTREYAEAVIDEEWPTMANGQASPHAAQLADEIGRVLRLVEVQTPREQVLMGQGLTIYHTILDNRHTRLYQSREGIHPSLWIVLISGAVVTISFTYLFGLESTAAHMLMIGALTIVLAGILFMIHATDLPFDGDVQVEPVAMQLILAAMPAP